MDFQKIIKENKTIIIIFFIALIVRIILMYATPIPWWDEAVYSNLGYDLSNNPFEYSLKSAGWSDSIPSGGDPVYGWPNIGFRAPLLSYCYALLYSVNLDFLVEYLLVIIGSVSCILVYILGKELFNKKVGIYSALFFSLIPLNVFYSGQMLTGTLFTFFILLTFICFWKGYEKGSNKNKLLFGVFFAFALLSRYTALWFAPIFLIYLLIRYKSLKFLKDKYLWGAIALFLVVLIPLFLYGQFTYHHILGAFLHGFKAAAYWGGVQPWYYFFQYWIPMFSAIGVLFIFALVKIFGKEKQFKKKEVYLLLTWLIFFLGMAILMPHKEDRFILSIVPVISILAGNFFSKIKKNKKEILTLLLAILVLHLGAYYLINNQNSDSNVCFREANEYISLQKNTLTITDESAITYYYTKSETMFYPAEMSSDYLKIIMRDHNETNNYILMTDFDKDLKSEENILILKDYENNLEKVFECSKEEGYSVVYKIY